MKKLIVILVFLITATCVLSSQPGNFTYKPLQITFFVPPLGLNGMQYGKCVNTIALNLFWGHSAGVRGVEFGGFLNSNAAFMHGAQYGGFANLVGDEVVGMQWAGFANIVGSLKYVQFAGFANIVKNDMHGFQGAGFINLTGGYARGTQVSGFLNQRLKSIDGHMVAGFANYSDSGKLQSQWAGFANYGGQITKAQVSGFANLSEDVKGVQAAGFINVAKHVKGLQLAGFINICDSIDGIPIAPISYVRNGGYRAPGFSTNERSPFNVEYRIGVKPFYTILTVGKLYGHLARYHYGGGLGSMEELGNGLNIHVELSMTQELWINEKDAPSFLYSGRTNHWYKFFVGFEKNLNNHLSLYLGPALNMNLAKDNKNQQNTGPDLSPSRGIYKGEFNRGRTRLNAWIGINAGIML